jgi:peptidase E
MKLFLASSANKTIHLLKDLYPEVGTKVLFIANAADPYEDTWWVDLDRNAFIDAGYAVTDLDLRNTNEPTFKELLTQTDVLHVCGGSVSYLGWLLKEKNVTASLLEAVMSDNVVYTGTSAGSMIVSKDLAMFSYDDREEKEYVEKGFDKKGLGLIPWTIAPHSDSQDFTESHKRVIDELVTNPTAVVLLHDNQALWVENDAVRFLSA